MRRGDVHWVQDQVGVSGSEIKKKRPWIIVGNNALNRARKTVIAVPLSTSAPESPPISFKVSVRGSLVVAICDQIRAIDKNKFEKTPFDALSVQDMALIDDGLKQVLALQ